ncbi:hypothetical protein EBZ39_18855, partial [bacterium]|nr:hypothetical protein [bacterium]
PAATNDLTFEKAVFVPDATTPRLYLSHAGAAADAADEPYLITRAELTTDDAGKAAVKMVGITPDASVNGKPAAVNELITGNGSQLIAAVGSSGLAVVPTADSGNLENKRVYLITDATKDGATQLKLNQKNATGADEGLGNPTLGQSTEKIAAIAAAAGFKDNDGNALGDFIFVANTPSAATWETAGAAGRGIAILGAADKVPALTQRDTRALQKPVEPGDAWDNNRKGAVVDFTAIPNADLGTDAANAGIAMKGAANPVGSAVANSDKVDLFWDGNFKRLYMGLDIKGANVANGQGTLIGVHSVRLNDDGTGLITPVLENVYSKFAEAMITDNDYHFIVAGSHQADHGNIEQVVVSVPKVRTMKTSTNKDYLVVASKVAVQAGNIQGIFAVPLTQVDT